MFVSARAYPDGTGDEPQHRLMGSTVRPLFESLGVIRQDMPEDPTSLGEVLDRAEEAMRAGRSAAIMVPKGRIHSGGPPPPWGRDYPLSRQQALDVIVRHLTGDEAIVSTTGLISRELFARHDRRGNFYMQGSMGHARAIALGIALCQPGRTVIVLDGDGAALMHLGTMSTVGHYGPRRLVDIVLDNEAHGSTGNQDTTSSTTELARVAEACRYARASRCTTEAELETALVTALGADGPSYLLVKVNREQGELPRITTEYPPEETARLFRAFLRPAGPPRAT
jgi:phosphonopyruvate decarboxylase